MPVLDFDNPDVGIKALLALQQGMNVKRSGGRCEFDGPSPFALLVMGWSGCGTKQMAGAVEMADDHIDCARLLGSPLHHSAEDVCNQVESDVGSLARIADCGLQGRTPPRSLDPCRNSFGNMGAAQCVGRIGKTAKLITRERRC